MINKEQITGLRQGASDQSVFDYLISQDANFKSAVERVQSQNQNMGPLEQHHFPTAMIDLYFDIDQGKKSDPLTTQATTHAMEKQVAPPQEQSFVGETIRNVPESAARFAGDIFNAITHPFQTAGALAETVVGGGANAVESIAALAGVENAEQIFDLPEEDVASAVGDFFVERYGGVENIKETVKTDPVGFLADLAGVLSVAGGALKGAGFVARGAGATGRAGLLTKAGQAASKAASITDPVAAVGRVAGAPFSLLGKAVGKINKQNFRSAFNLTPSQMQRINKLGIAPDEFFAKEGIVANSVDDAVVGLKNVHTGSYDDVNQALASTAGTFDVANIDGLQGIIAQLDELFDFPGLEAQSQLLKNLAKKKELNLTEMNQIKRLIDEADFIYNRSGEVGASQKAAGGAVVRNRLKRFIEDEAAKQGIENIAEMNRRTQISKQILDEISKSAGKGERFLSFRDAIYGGSAGVILGPVGGFMTLAAQRLAATPAIATRINLALSSLSAAEFRVLQTALKTGQVTGDARRILQDLISILEEDESTTPQELPPTLVGQPQQLSE